VAPARASEGVVDVVARRAQQLDTRSEAVDGKRARGPFDANAQRFHVSVLDSSTTTNNNINVNVVDVVRRAGPLTVLCLL
jgi:hypothetical protein